MHSFIGLVKKDLKLARFGYVIWLIGTFLTLLGSYFLAVKVQLPLVVAIFYIMLVVLHIPLGALIIVSLLNIEGKTQLWLYNPQGSAKLLFGKLLAMAIYLVSSQLLFVLYGWILFKWLEMKEAMHGLIELIPWKESFILYALIFGAAVTLALWIIFLWTIYHSLGRIAWLSRLRWLVVVLIIVVYNVISALLEKVQLIHDFIHQWAFKIQFATSLHYEHGEWSVIYSEQELPIISMIISIVIMSAMFYISSYLLNKKVEV